MTRYRKKPVEVEAWQVGDEQKPEWVLACVKNRSDRTGMTMTALTINGSRNCTYGNILVLENGLITEWTMGGFKEAYEAVNDAED